MTERERSIVLTTISMCRGILRGLSDSRDLNYLLHYQQGLEKAWQMPPVTREMPIVHELLKEVNDAIKVIHPEWTKGGF